MAKAGLVLLVETSLAIECCALFHRNQLAHEEAAALVQVPLPLPKDPGELMRTLVAAIPTHVVASSLAQALSKPEPYVPGVGVNPSFFKWALENADALQRESDHFTRLYPDYTLSLLSTVSLSSLRNGHPNCELTGTLALATVEGGESPFHAALRGALLDASLALHERVLLLPHVTALSHDFVDYEYLKQPGAERGIRTRGRGRGGRGRIGLGVQETSRVPFQRVAVITCFMLRCVPDGEVTFDSAAMHVRVLPAPIPKPKATLSSVSLDPDDALETCRDGPMDGPPTAATAAALAAATL
jgi:hypothetical protein